MKTQAMFMHVTDAKYLGGHRVWLRFNDGAEGEVDLAGHLGGEIFRPLRDVEFFKSFAFEGHTLAWSNGADFAPEFLRERIGAGSRSPMVAEDEGEYGES